MSAEITLVLPVLECACITSMGPRSDERGNTAANPNMPAARRLQWGRAQMSAEISQVLFMGSSIQLLQWGRAQMSAEMWKCAKPKKPPADTSMGPRSDERGNAR